MLLVGQPNVGKSTILNALTGARVMISNYPGTTIDISSGSLMINGENHVFVDTPGVYSLTPSSEEEKVTDRMILEGDYDFIIQVADATSLGKNLILTYQLAELGKPFILALNFFEEAEKRGIRIDVAFLEKIVGVPVVRVNPVKRRMEELLNRMGDARPSRLTISYDDHIEEAASRIEEILTVSGFSRRGIAIKLLENDSIALEMYGNERILEIIATYRRFHPNMEQDIMVTRAGHAVVLEEKVVEVSTARKSGLSWLDRLIVNRPVGGAIFSILVFGFIFLTLFYLGGWFQDTLSEVFDLLLLRIKPWLGDSNSLLKEIVENSLMGLGAGISIAIPYVGIFYFLLALMEDTGIPPRFIVSLNGIMNKLGLPGRSIIPMMLGLGCSVPAIRATRVLSSFKDRLKVSALFMTIPCSSRSAVIFGVVGHHAGLRYAIWIYVIAFSLLAFTARILNRLIESDHLPMVEELPPYRKPIFKNLMMKAWIRMADFVYLVIPLLIVGGMLYGLLQHYDLINPFVRFFDVLTVKWLNLPSRTIIPILYGFLQKDLVPAMLNNALGTSDFSSVMTNHQLFIFGLATTLQVPCVISLGMLMREFGVKRSVFVWMMSFLYGMFWSGVVNKLLLLF